MGRPRTPPRLPRYRPGQQSRRAALRTPVVGRKNYYGSHAKWSADLAARVWTITATAQRNHREPLAYLTEYLQACATAAGKPPQGHALQQLLPWLPDTPDSRADDPPKTIQPDTGTPTRILTVTATRN